MTRSAQELRQESERRRADLTATVDQLKERISETTEDIRHKVSSDHIKSEVSEYVRHRSQSWIETLKHRASENPIKAVAAGTVVAVPLLRLTRGFPLPILMIGAGLALTSKRVREGAARSAAPMVERAGDIKDDMVERAQSLGGNVKDALSSAQRRAAGMANDAQDTAAGLIGRFQNQTAQVSSTADDKISTSVTAARKTAAAAKDSVASAPAKAGQLIGDNAALIGGLGIAIGAIVAAALPETRVEASAIGPASDNVRRLAGEAAQTGVEAAKDATISSADAAAASVAEADLGGHASRMTKNITDALKAGADDAVSAAFNASQKPNT